MGIFTAHDDPRVDEAIGSHMQAMAKLCCSAFGSNLASVVLSGSFGRGEGSAILHPNGSVEPLRDYDMRLITHSPVQSQQLETVRSEFMKATSLGDTQEQFSGQRGFSVTLEPLTTGQLRTSFVRGRDLRVYDHLNASLVVWGEEHAETLKFPAADIPRVNGLRLLYQKMMGLVGHYPGPDCPRADTEATRRTLLYECDKTFVEICTALTLLAGHYLPSYRGRAEQFSLHWRRWFPQLAKALPDLDAQVQRATAEKLRPGSTGQLPVNQAVAQARRALSVVHRHYVKALYGVEVVPDQAGAARLSRLLQHDYFRVELMVWLKERRMNNPVARWALNAAYNRKLRLDFARALGLTGSKALWESMYPGRGEAPHADIFLAAWCALAAMRLEPGSSGPNTALLNRAEELLDRLSGFKAVVPANRKGDAGGWSYYRSVRERLIRAYSLWEGSR